MTYFEVWGWDTFAGEEYLVGRYYSRKEAENVRLKEENEASETQSSGLRDTFSVLEISDEQIRWREREEEHLRKEKEAERAYDPLHLEQCVRHLLQKYCSGWLEADRKGESRKIRNLSAGADWKEAGDCFTRLELKTFSENETHLTIRLTVTCRSGKHFGGGTSSRAFHWGTRQEIGSWLQSDAACEDILAIAAELIRHLYRN